jgi:hypothetical protein
MIFYRHACGLLRAHSESGATARMLGAAHSALQLALQGTMD